MWKKRMRFSLNFGTATKANRVWVIPVLFTWERKLNICCRWTKATLKKNCVIVGDGGNGNSIGSLTTYINRDAPNTATFVVTVDLKL